MKKKKLIQELTDVDRYFELCNLLNINTVDLGGIACWIVTKKPASNIEH